MAYKDVVLADSPQVYWKLDEASGTTVNDSSGNARNVTLGGAPTWGKTSLIGTNTAVAFTADTQKGSLAALPVGTGLTVEAWIKTAHAGPGHSRVLTRDAGLGNARHWSLAVLSDGRVYFLVFGADISYELITTAKVNDNLVHHIVAVLDPAAAADQQKIYIDGALSVFQTNTNTALETVTDEPVYISGTPFNAEYMIGVLDEVAIYGTALNATRIKAHFDAGVTPGLLWSDDFRRADSLTLGSTAFGNKPWVEGNGSFQIAAGKLALEATGTAGEADVLIDTGQTGFVRATATTGAAGNGLLVRASATGDTGFYWAFNGILWRKDPGHVYAQIVDTLVGVGNGQTGEMGVDAKGILLLRNLSTGASYSLDLAANAATSGANARTGTHVGIIATQTTHTYDYVSFSTGPNWADNFLRADSETLGSTPTGNKPWIEVGFGAKISGNSLMINGDDSMALVNCESPEGRIRVAVQNGDSASGWCIVFRCDGTTGNRWLWVPFTSKLVKVVAGVSTEVAALGPAVAIGDIVEVDVFGSIVTARNLTKLTADAATLTSDLATLTHWGFRGNSTTASFDESEFHGAVTSAPAEVVAASGFIGWGVPI